MKSKDKNKNIKILIGMTGGIDSAVSAFLLKKQGYTVIGLSILFIPDEIMNKNDEFYKSCSVNDFEKIKRLCETLKIPLYGVNACSEFEDKIFSSITCSKIKGTFYNPCMDCNEMKVRLLYEKSEKLKTNFIATGHYAKLDINRQKGEIAIISSYDKENDQSYLLSRIEPRYLRKFIFPLGDILKSEVLKIANSFGLPIHDRKEPNNCFSNPKDLIDFVKKSVPQELIDEGMFQDKEGLQLFEHGGFHNYQLGQTGLDEVKKSSIIDKNSSIVEFNYSENTIVLGDSSSLEFRMFLIKDVKYLIKVNKREPLSVKVKLSIKDKFREASLFFKNNNQLVIELLEKTTMKPGGIATIYSESGKQFKIIASGIVEIIKNEKLINRIEHVEDGIVDEEGKYVPKIVNVLKF
jgi:tRNA-uridine 2-sulfurtransferase